MKIHKHKHAVDLAVDWIEDKLYWTSNDNLIRVLDIAVSLEETGYQVIEVQLVEAKFSYIVLDPLNRCVLCTLIHVYHPSIPCNNI